MIPSHFGGEILADDRSDDKLALVRYRETVDIWLNDHPAIWPHIFAGYQPLHQAAAYLRPSGPVVDSFKVGQHIRGQGRDRLDRHPRRFTLRWLSMLEQHMASGILHNDILNPGHVRDKGDPIVSILVLDDLKLGLNFILKAVVAVQYLLGPRYNLLVRVCAPRENRSQECCEVFFVIRERSVAGLAYADRWKVVRKRPIKYGS